MANKILFKIGSPLLALLLVTSCGEVEEEEDSFEEEEPLNQYEENMDNGPTENEMNDEFGEELDENKEVERDIPKNQLESDEETESDE
ncbi:hypothetical protein [Alteribacillus iranensis]|uniref:Uncharacterized protein n=1 Tax=Alteribacillus iranensis TaxID=930128 RepID=A0A1I2BL36_9BACI|nr:hypothetical protein [Alteribacillus iranensis]SFE56508.1 hypothetical protein SAMN05192532_102351 [Alteribacillus iranensis]